MGPPGGPHRSVAVPLARQGSFQVIERPVVDLGGNLDTASEPHFPEHQRGGATVERLGPGQKDTSPPFDGRACG